MNGMQVRVAATVLMMSYVFRRWPFLFGAIAMTLARRQRQRHSVDLHARPLQRGSGH